MEKLLAICQEFKIRTQLQPLNLAKAQELPPVKVYLQTLKNKLQVLNSNLRELPKSQPIAAAQPIVAAHSFEVEFLIYIHAPSTPTVMLFQMPDVPQVQVVSASLKGLLP